MGESANHAVLAPEPGLRIVCIPSTDPDMCGVVQRLYDSIRWVTPDRLENALREVYPRAVVRRRDLAGEPMPTWYVYREGTDPAHAGGQGVI
jgi:hypothetical protein